MPTQVFTEYWDGEPDGTFDIAKTTYVAQDIDGKVDKTGQTGTVDLSTATTVVAAPVADTHAATKLYVDTTTGDYLPLAGGTLTGPLVIQAPDNSATPAAPLPAAVSVIDPVTGRVTIIGGAGGTIEIGDTGWRNVAALLNGSLIGAVGKAGLRRSGDLVEIYLDLTAGASPINGFTNLFTDPLPSGFRPGSFPGAREATFYDTSGVFLTSGSYTSTGTLLARGQISGATRFRVSFNLTTTDAWPVALPGAPA